MGPIGMDMAEQWHIYKTDGSQIGPLSPLEVRDALREGSVDPFDLACRVGSSVKRPLVEVDEIFLAAEQSEKGKVDSVYDQPQGAEAEVTLASGRAAVGASSPRAPTNAVKKTQLSKPAVTYSAKPAPSPQKRHAKKYFIVDKKNRFHGPLSAPEIQSLFYKGLVQANALVARDRKGQRVPVQQFVSAYAGAKANKYDSEQTKFNFEAIKVKRVGFPSSKDMDQWARTVAQQAYIAPQKSPWLTAIFIGAAMLVLFLVIQYGVIPRLMTGHDAHVETPANSINIEPINPEDSIEVVAPTPQKIEVQVPKKEVKATAKKDKKPAPKREQAKLPRRAPVQPIVRNVPMQPRTAPVAPSAPVAKTSAAAVSANAAGLYAARNNQVISIPGANYNVAELAACGLKCTLSMTDTKGTNLDVIFFKAQFEGLLKARAGKAAVSGRLSVQGNRNVLYLQSVK